MDRPLYINIQHLVMDGMPFDGGPSAPTEGAVVCQLTRLLGYGQSMPLAPGVPLVVGPFIHIAAHRSSTAMRTGVAPRVHQLRV